MRKMLRTVKVPAAAGMAILSLLVAATAWASTPSSGTISTLTPNQAYSAGPFLVANVTPVPLVDNGPTCDSNHPCDHYALTVTLPSDYQSTHPNDAVIITASWPVVTSGVQSDYDLWVYDSQGNLVPTSSQTSNDPEVAILPAVSGVYDLTLVPFHPAGETVNVTISLATKPPVGYRTGTYLAGTDVWSKNIHLTGQGLVISHDQDGEPAVKIDKNGTTYVTSNGAQGIGIPGALGMWKITEPCAQTFQFLEPESPFTNGGGDCDVEVAGELNALGNYNVYTSSLHGQDALANINTSVSVDGGKTFVTSPISDATPVNDREWTAAYGANTVYLSYRSLNTGNNLFVYRSTAAGAPGTFQGPFPVYADVVTSALLNTQLGNLVSDQRPVPGGTLPLMSGPNGEGTLYHGFILGGNQIYVGVSHDMGTTWHSSLVFSGPPGTDYGKNFSWVAVDLAGNVYTCFCDQANFYYSASSDQGAHWTRPTRVNNGVAAKSCTMPTMAAGSVGRLVFSWYSSSTEDAIHNTSSQWTVMASRTENALDSVPTFEQVLASDHIVKTGPVCLDGSSCGANRELLDLFEMDVNQTDGSAFITYTDDSNGRGTFITKQLAGVSAITGKSVSDKTASCPTNVPCLSNCPPPPPLNPCTLPGVTVVRDAVGDEKGAPAATFADIDSIMIAEPFFVDGSNKLDITLKVEHLNPDSLPQDTEWEVLWTSPNGTTYFVDMNTLDPTTGVQFNYGHEDPTLGDVTDGTIQGRLNQLGFITMTVDNGLVGNPAAGQVLSGVNARTEVQVGATVGGTGGGELVFLDTAGSGSYALVGNASCGLFGISCPSDQTASGGTVVPLLFRLTNNASTSKSFQYTLRDSLGWTIGQSAPLSGQTPSLAPGASFTLEADAQVPAGCSNGSDGFNWSAYPAGDPADAEACAMHLSCGAPMTPCRLPGVPVIADASGDQAGSPELTQFDLQKTYFAEPYTTDGSHQLVVTMKVDNLTPPLTPNGVWRSFWTAPNDSTYYVAMSTDQTGAPTYAFGVFIVNATTGTITQTRKGTAVGSESADGTIQITSPLVYAGDPPPGSLLRSPTSESRLLVGTSVTGGLIEQVDAAAGPNYTMEGNAACALQLTAPANRTVGCDTLPLQFAVTNSEQGAASFTYQLGDSLGWTVSSSAPVSGQTPTLAPGASFTLSIKALPPSSPSTDEFVWTAALSGSPTTSRSRRTLVSDTCTATPAAVADLAVAELQQSGQQAGFVKLEWQTHATQSGDRIVVYRSLERDGKYTAVSPQIEARPDTRMSYEDRQVQPGMVYFYKLELHNGSDGAAAVTAGPLRVTTRAAVLALHAPSPNPFSRETRLAYELPSRGRVSMLLYSVNGQQVRTLVDEVRDAGTGTATLNGRDLPAGVYYVRMEAAGKRLVQKVMLLH